ncbi:MAG: hypothetical protein K9G60_01890 [Pseudolabrys sp.]|nr:hypothetical protein [Pseudolabrys sp.]
MSTPAELIANRAAAGARFVDAVAELKAAYIDLDAHDRVRATPQVATQQTGGRFMGERRFMLDRLQHPEFLPTIVGDWEADIVAATTVKAKAYGTPDPE